MQFSYFKALALPWQAHIICECGKLLSERQNDKTLVELYQIDSFFAEVHYRQSDNEIMKISSFQDSHYLEPYSEKISLRNLVARNGNKCIS